MTCHLLRQRSRCIGEEEKRKDFILCCQLFVGGKEMHPEETHRCTEETNGPVEETTLWCDQEKEVSEKEEKMRMESFIQS